MHLCEVDHGLASQVIYMRPAKLLQRNAGQHVPLEDRLAFQSATNEAAHFLLMAASQKAGYHLESIVQVLQSHISSPDQQSQISRDGQPWKERALSHGNLESQRAGQ